MQGRLDVSTSWSDSQSSVAIDLFQPDSLMLKDGWNGAATLTGGVLSSATGPTDQVLYVPWTMSKPVQVHSRTGMGRSGISADAM